MNKHIFNIFIAGDFSSTSLFGLNRLNKAVNVLPNIELTTTLPHLAHFPHAKQAIEFAANKEREKAMNELLGGEKESQVEGIIRNARYIANPNSDCTKIHNENRISKSQPKLSRKERRKK